MTLPVRLAREKKTMAVMVEMYCRAHHGVEDHPCAGCKALLEYASQKIDRCPFHEVKPICANCRIHCYKGPMRELVRTVMRYSGPRMLIRHPVLALLHVSARMRGNGG